MAWNLLLGGAYDRRTGYSWIEFGRLDEDGTPRYLTLGVGLLAVAARPHVEPWFFILEEQPGTRVGQDLWLVNAQRVVLTRERLREALAGHGQVFDNAAAYRRAVDERLFHLGMRRYDALMDTLIQLRQPQLSRRPDEASLSDALTDALPPLPQELLADVAEAMNQLEEDRRQLEDFQKLADAVERFDQRYRACAGVLSRRQARELRQAQTDFDNASRKRSEAASALETAQQWERKAAEDHAAADITLAGQRMRLDTLLSDPAMQDANRLDQAERDAQARRQDMVAAEAEHGEASGRLAREIELLAQRQARANAFEQLLRDARAACARQASAAGLAAEHGQEALAALAPPALADLPQREFDVSARALREAVGRRREHLAVLRRRLEAQAEAERTQRLQLQALAEKQDEAEAAAARRTEADDAVEAEAQAHVDAWARHAAKLQQLRLQAEPMLAVLTDWVLRLDGEHPGRQALHAAQQEASNRLAMQQAVLDAQRAAMRQEREELQAEQERLRAGVDATPPSPPTRGEGTRAGRAGAPLWQLVDFRDEVDASQRAGLEAALEASGLLDAWITPDGSLVRSGDDRPWLDAQWVLRHPCASPNLGQWLRVDVSAQTSVSAAMVERLLAAVACSAQVNSAWWCTSSTRTGLSGPTGWWRGWPKRLRSAGSC